MILRAWVGLVRIPVDRVQSSVLVLDEIGQGALARVHGTDDQDL